MGGEEKGFNIFWVYFLWYPHFYIVLYLEVNKWSEGFMYIFILYGWNTPNGWFLWGALDFRIQIRQVN